MVKIACSSLICVMKTYQNELWYCLRQYAIELAALSKYLDSQNTIRLRITINLIFYLDIALS